MADEMGSKDCGSNKEAECLPGPDEELDELLNSALGDFDKPPPVPVPAPTQLKVEDDATAGDLAEGFIDAQWTEEFIKQAASQFEQNMQSLLTQTTGGDPSEAVGQLGANFQKMAEAAAKVMTDDQASDSDFSAAISQTLRNLSEKADTLQDPFSEDELKNMFGHLGLGCQQGDGGEFLPFMLQMMQSLLSKDILHPALKDIADKYPAWLEENRSQLSSDDFERFTKQKDLMTEVCSELEQETESDSAELKKRRFDKILGLMQKMQDCGQPPQALVGDLGSVMSFDEEGNPKLPPGLDPSQCSVM